MNSQDDSNYEAFCKNVLLQGFKPSEQERLYTFCKPIFLAAGEVLIQEGELASELFFITKGKLEILKTDRNNNVPYVIATLNPGEAVGEVSFVDRGFRSASVRAATDVSVLSISFNDLEKFLNQSIEYSHIYVHLSKNISQRLRQISTTTLEVLKREVLESKARIRMGNFLIYVIIILSLFAYTLSSLRYLITIASNTSIVAFPVTMVISIYFIIMIKHLNLSWEEFGIKLTNWKEALFDGFVLSLPMILLAFVVKVLLIHFDSTYEGHRIFEPFLVILDPEHKNWTYWLILNAIYCFIGVPLQELLTRGILQGLLEDFFAGKYKIFISILLSNLLFSTLHIFFSVQIAIFVFMGGVFFGWIYSRSHNLIASSISHAFVGTWALSVIGVIVE